MTPLYKVLGYCGVIPFLIFTMGLYAFDEGIGKFLMAAQMIYAGLIASFLSGIHWSHSFQNSREGQMLCSMLPGLLSLFLTAIGLVILFGGLMTMLPSKLLLSLFFIFYALMFIAIYIFDWQWLDKSKLPDGYLAFRGLVTVLVAALLILSIGGIWLH